MARLPMLSVCVALTGCASLPKNAAVVYYSPKAKIHISGSQTLSCKDSVINYKFDAKADPVYSADTGNWHSFKFSAVSGYFNDVDISVELTPDGRLKGINSASTGEANAIVKGAAELSKTVQSVSGPPGPNATRNLVILLPYCASGTESELSASYAEDIDFPNIVAKAEAEAHADARTPWPGWAGTRESQWKTLAQHPEAAGRPFKELRLKATFTIPPKFPMDTAEITGPNDCAKTESSATPSPDKPLYVCAQQTGYLTLTLVAGPSDLNAEVFSGSFVVPLPKSYPVPITKARLFGKAGTSLTFDDAGGLVHVGYSKTNSAPEVLGALAGIGAIAAAAAK